MSAEKARNSEAAVMETTAAAVEEEIEEAAAAEAAVAVEVVQMVTTKEMTPLEMEAREVTIHSKAKMERAEEAEEVEGTPDQLVQRPLEIKSEMDRSRSPKHQENLESQEEMATARESPMVVIAAEEAAAEAAVEAEEVAEAEVVVETVPPTVMLPMRLRPKTDISEDNTTFLTKVIQSEVTP